MSAQSHSPVNLVMAAKAAILDRHQPAGVRGRVWCRQDLV